ncbi:MAG TPA: hypothetical protein V6C81_32215 [Planktothrix sp.]|jgi:hypothetical protein
MAPSIAIIAHEHDDFITRRSHLREVARIWQDNGFDVGVYIRPTKGARADIAILHVNLTVVPQEYLEFAQSFPIALNGRVADISKREISQQILDRDSKYDGPVLVKGNENYGGAPEKRMEGLLAKAAAQTVSVHSTPSPASQFPRLSTYEYYVVDSVNNVPEDVWLNPNLVVEKFLPEKEGDLYIMRNWHFLGDGEYHTKCWGHNPIVKGSHVLKREPITEPIPSELREIRRRLNFDFGKWDYALVDGKPVVFDVNKTPNLGALNEKQAKPKFEILSKGIYKYLSK